MEAQYQKGRCPGCQEFGSLLVESDHSIGCDSCEGLWEIEELLRIISDYHFAKPPEAAVA
tara:strand:- start:70 stop:249 length:180 start_codon:yes stop_codon:yes gene_type:complete